MDQQQCIFCSIAGKQVKSFVVYEDENSTAFLDIAPRSHGMTIVVPKKHYKDFDQDPEMSAKVFLSAEKVAVAIKQALSPIAVIFSTMPSQVQHFHVKVYPVYENEIPLIENQPKQVEEPELVNVAQAIASAMPSEQFVHQESVQPMEESPKVEMKKPEAAKPEEKKEEKKKRTKEEEYWIRRGLEIA